MTAAALVAVTAVILLALTLAWARFSTAALPSQGSIAVIPVLGMPAGSEVEYLADGISEGVIDRLAEAGGALLKVIALASAVRLKSRPIDPREVGPQTGGGKMGLLRGC